jgi:HD-GYP domain-containing protein (c-di-GMP phosphodiesterase class II)
MFKTVSTSSLRPGMFLHSLDRRWLHHPFWKSSFLLCADDIVKIMLTDIQSVVIDTEKGLDVEVDASTTYDRSDALDLIEVDLEPLLPVAPGERGQERKRRRSVANEMNHARRLFESACDHMKLVLQDARFGNVISSATMMPLVEAIAASVARSPHALTSVARLKRHDGYTYMHSVAVCALMTALARELKLDEQAVFEAGVAGLMHDVGKALCLTNPESSVPRSLKLPSGTRRTGGGYCSRRM